VTTGRRAGASSNHLTLPELTPFGGDRLAVGGDHDAADFVDLDLAGQDASDARFLECRLLRCCLDGASLRRARIVESLLADINATSLDLSDSTWRDAEITGGRLGAVAGPRATWTNVRLRGTKLGFVDLAGARLEDVLFERCEIGSLDVRSARLHDVAFVDCTVDELTVAGAELSRVDLSGARLRSLVGVESLRGAIIGADQLIDLAPLLAAGLGIQVRHGD
jgi:uncharacterized protein YjbI with pentapeptide repeats